MRTKLFLTALLISALPALAGAESVIWSGVQPDLIAVGNDKLNIATQYLYDPMVSITYNVSILELDANSNVIRPLPNGTSVPSGTRVLLRFEPHQYSDIYWFGIGGGYDSPYGDWVAGAGAPAESERCAPKNLYHASFVTTGTGHTNWLDLFAALTAAPPAKSITTSAGVSCVGTPDGVSKVCTMGAAGPFTANFIFSPTQGEFYSGYKGIPGKSQSGHQNQIGGNYCAEYSRRLGNVSMSLYGGKKAAGGDYTLQVPQQTIPVNLTVTAPVGTPPSTPSLNSGGSCTLGTPHAITITANDPDGDRLRYGVDWDANGSIDEYVPASGYVNSGTAQTVSRTYATAGGKTVNVIAQDEGGLSSGWAAINFNCSPPPDEEDDNDPPPPPPPTNCPVGYTLQNNACVFTGCPSGFTLQGSACVMVITQCTPGNFCIGNNLYHRNTQCTQSLVQNCIFGCSGNSCRSAPQGTGNIVALPSLVTVGGTATVSWQTSGMESCVVTDNNPQITTNRTGESGSFTTGALNQQTVFTLTCDRDSGGSFTDSVTVNIVPVFIEN
jgi:hypothetical protein